MLCCHNRSQKHQIVLRFDHRRNRSTNVCKLTKLWWVFDHTATDIQSIEHKPKPSSQLGLIDLNLFLKSSWNRMDYLTVYLSSRSMTLHIFVVLGFLAVCLLFYGWSCALLVRLNIDPLEFNWEWTPNTLVTLSTIEQHPLHGALHRLGRSQQPIVDNQPADRVVST